jgi:hypothetical protein
MHSIPDIYFKTIEIESVESVEDNPEAVTFDISLTSTPPPHWLEEFVYLYGRAQFGLKPPIEIIGDKMHIMYLPRYSDDLQGFVYFLGDILVQSTKEARRTIEISQTDEKQRVKSEFQESLSKLKLPSPSGDRIPAVAGY